VEKFESRVEFGLRTGHTKNRHCCSYKRIEQSLAVMRYVETVHFEQQDFRQVVQRTRGD